MTDIEGKKRPRGTARDRALGLLAVRWRSQSEIERRLRMAGFEPEEIGETLIDLKRAGLIEDGRFAREMVRDQTTRRLAGDRAIRSALLLKGVPRDIADLAIEEAGAEETRASALASKAAARMAGLSGETVHRRLFSLLVRRGYGSEVAQRAVREAIAELEGIARAVDEP
jgi:regulatory protein